MTRPRLELHMAEVASSEKPDEIVALDEALALLEKQDAFSAQVVKLRFFAGLSLSEAAQVMKRSEEAVKKLIHRGLADLRRRLAHTPGADASVEVNE